MIFKWPFKKKKATPYRDSVKEGNVFSKFKSSLLKTRNVISGNIDILFSKKRYISEDVLEELEKILIESDISLDTSIELLRSLSEHRSSLLNSYDVKGILRREILKIFSRDKLAKVVYSSPYVSMVVGVNGVGKSSTIGKLAALELKKGRKCLVAACDLFRAASLEQIEAYASQAEAHVIKNCNTLDPASVAYDAVSKAVSKKFDVVFIDTAGRLHTKLNLMNELCRIKRVINKKLMDAPHEVALVIDSTTGRNSLNQVEIFNKVLGLTSIIVSKLDSSSKGGVIIDIVKKFGIPIRYVTTGEKIDEIEVFNSKDFVESII